ncbi:hypothetical protein VIBNIPon4_110023 [Vibrio nigripulchritudo POn4]|nr:hypothetical protein VIBNIAM115_910003 [Vibrio nigripulchritudo AM115]CCN43353.1 hypothetical protein VIBNIFTn2_500005 [Vibrio nigripulchritudo FTn2]CCN63104.1 hypothetical protein VIBNIPon4_110023 [Vibrio nigripulchritudo POn4]
MLVRVKQIHIALSLTCHSKGYAKWYVNTERVNLLLESLASLESLESLESPPHMNSVS